MDLRLGVLGLVVVLLAGAAAVAFEPHAGPPPPPLPARNPFFPRSPPSTNVTVVPVEFTKETLRITATSLQGLVNSRGARIYLEPSPPSSLDAGLLDILRTRHGVTTAIEPL